MKNYEVLRELKQVLYGTQEADAEAKVILAHVHCYTLSDLHLRLFDECGSELVKRATKIAQKRATGCPLAYILQSKWFYGREFYVDEGVLIPRYDTECVVQEALKQAHEKGCKTALDLCCGSGCIGITLAYEGSLDRVVLSDISEDALQVAQKNIERLDHQNICTLQKSDLLESVDEKFDLIVCNPPYISEGEFIWLDRQVKEFEPKLALVAEENGYALYESILKDLKRCMTGSSTLVFEIGDTQFEGIKQLLLAAGFDNIKCGFDLVGRPRFIVAEECVC